MNQLAKVTSLVMGGGFCFFLSACVVSPAHHTSEQPVSVTASGGNVAQQAEHLLVTAGQSMPLKQVTTVDGTLIRLDEIGKKKLLVLFATWCSDSQRAMKALNQSPLLEDNQITLVAIAREQSVAEITKWKTEQNMRIAMVADTDRSIYRLFANSGIPRFILVDENNKVVKTVLAESDNPMALIHWE